MGRRRSRSPPRHATARASPPTQRISDHVAGATELPPLKPRQKQAARPAVDMGPIIAGPPITEIGFDVADPRGRLVAWVIERWKIYLRKEAGEPEPWTAEPIMADRKNRFCNAHRENDTGTRRVAADIVARFQGSPDLWFPVAAARWCSNEPAAWAELLPFLLPTFDAAGYRSKVETLLAAGRKVYRTNAYKPVMPPRELKGTSMAEFHTDHVLGPMWRDRERLRPQSGETLAAFSARLEEWPRIGLFLAGQVVADLKHAEALRSAVDWWTFAVSGPGSRRGLNRARNRPVNAPWSEAQWYHELMTLQAEIAELLATENVPPLDAQNAQNVLCEFDKWERVRDVCGSSHAYQPKEPARKPRAAKKATPSTETVPAETPIAPADTPSPEPEATAAIGPATEDTPAPALAGNEQQDAAPSQPAPPDLVEIDGCHVLPEVVTAEWQGRPRCLPAALAYAARGWCIFPAPRGTKKSHKAAEHSDGRRWGATDNPDEIRRDYAHWPQANVGIPTGAENGIWVLEADTKEGGHEHDGIAALCALEAKYGALPATLQAQSPSGSLHF